jgi:two-component system, NtrC family, sensor kinase
MSAGSSGWGLLMCLVAATVGVTTLYLAGFAALGSYGLNWWTWCLGDTVGVLLLTPLVLAWRSGPEDGWRVGGLAEAGVLLGVLLVVTWWVFGGWNPLGVDSRFLVYLTVPPLVWGAFRFGLLGATLGLVVVTGIAVWGTAQGQGPFVRESLNESLLLLQTFIGVLAVTVLVLVGVLAERRQAERAQARLIERLQQALNEVNTIRGLIPICAWCKRIRNDAGAWQQLELYLGEHSEAEFSHCMCPECAETQRAIVLQKDPNVHAP